MVQLPRLLEVVFFCFNCNVAYALSIAPVIYLLHQCLQSILEGNNAGAGNSEGCTL